MAEAVAGAVKPRLLVLASTYPRWSGDPEPGFVHELARRLTDRFEVAVIAPHARGAKTREMLDGVEVHRYRYAPARLEALVNDGGMMGNLKRAPWKWLLVPGFLLGLLFAVARQILRARPAAIHAHWLVPQGLVVALLGLFYRRMPPFLVTSHGADLWALRRWPLPSIKRFVAERAHGLTVVSAAMKEELQRLGVDSGKVAVQPMGVDLTERFTPDPAVARSRDEILFVGRLVEKKGLRFLIEAMPTLLAARPATRLTIAGFGPEEVTLRRRVTELALDGNVDFLGAVRQAALPALYRRAAVFVAPFVQTASGDQEGLGLVSVEALGCGCPVVASDLPATRDVIPGGVPPGDSRALASRILDILSLGESELCEFVDVQRDKIQEKFDWKSVSARYVEKLLEAVRESERWARER